MECKLSNCLLEGGVGRGRNTTGCIQICPEVVFTPTLPYVICLVAILFGFCTATI